MNDRLASLLVRAVARTVIWVATLIGAVVKIVRHPHGRLVIASVFVVLSVGLVLAVIGGKGLSPIVRMYELTTDSYETHD